MLDNKKTTALLKQFFVQKLFISYFNGQSPQDKIEYMGKNIFVLHLLIPEFSWQSFLLSTHLHESMNAERLII